MKKFPLLISACASLLAACSENGASSTDESGLTFHVSARDMFDTRADIYSSDAIQSIDGCKVYVFQSTDSGASYKYLKTFDFDSLWQRGWNSVTHRLSKDEMLPNGMYRFLAVGMDGLTDYTLPAMTAGTTDYAAVAATLNSATPQELFSGMIDHTISSSIETVRVLMSRRVAGVMGYFTNVPATVDGLQVRTLRLAVQGSSTVVDITSNPEAQLVPPAASGAGYNIFNVDLTTQAVENGIYTGNTVPGGVGKLANTTLVGAYVIPAAYTTGVTLTLSLLGGADGTVVLRTWPVRDDTGATTYGILSNHIYSLGRKLQSANTVNGNDDPGDDDLPIDFAAQTLVANIAAGWRTTHQMSLQEPTP